MVDISQHLSVRIVKVDYYLTKPISELDDPCYSGFRSSPIYHVPVLRIFGSTADGIKCCVHVHGVFPYIYIPNWSRELREKDFYAFAAGLDKAINTSFACSASKTCHVHKISVVSGRPYYGYYEDEREFLKIEFYNPAIVKRASDLLLNAAVFNTSYQPCEAHVPYILQFFIDNNLYGMSYAKFSSFRGRTVIETDVPKQTNMALEVDSSVRYIIRDSTSADEMPNNPGLAFIWEEERKRKRAQKCDSQITPNVSQVRPDRKPTKTESYYMNKLAEKLKRFLTSKTENRISASNSTVEEGDTVTFHKQFNTQAQDIFAMLEELNPPNGAFDGNRSDMSPPSSPSIVYSDDEEVPEKPPFVTNVDLIRSQPMLKQTAENDSILGDNFSDDDIDEEDHLMLSQSVYQAQHEESSDDEFAGELENIPQLDGADGAEIPIESKRRAKPEKKPRRYNLRSANVEVQKSNDKKNTPKKQYPQLEIATQVSPIIARTSPSVTEVQSCCPTPETFLSSSVTDSYRSPTAGSPSEGRKSESKRLYPQLDVNFQKSPRSANEANSESELRRHKLPTSLKKRKIDFDALDKDTNSGISMTTRWKRLQGSKRGRKSSVDDSENKNVSDFKILQCDVEDLDTVARDATYIIKGRDKTQNNISSPAFCTVGNEVGSQKYSLKIHFDACGSINRDEVLQSLLTKEPVVMIEKMNFFSSSVTETGHSCDGGEGSQPDVVDNRQDVNSAPPFQSGTSQSSSETKKSLEVDFWDIGDIPPLDDVANSDIFRLSASSNSLSETIIPSSNSRCSTEFDSCDSFPKNNNQGQSPSPSQESDNNYPTPDVLDDRELFPDARSYSSVNDEQFLSPEATCEMSALRCSKVIVEERIPDLSVFEAPPTVIDDEHMAMKTRAFNFDEDMETTRSQERVLLDTTKGAKSIAALYSSINDDEFPAPQIELKIDANEADDSDPVIFSQNSESEQIFAEFNLSQVQTSSAEKVKLNSPLKQPDNLDERMSKTNSTSSCEPSSSPLFVADNSVWDTTENTSNEDDRILSFYEDKSMSAVNATQFCDKKNDSSVKGVPGVESSTPEREREILSWNNEESLFEERLSSTDALSDEDADKLSRRLSGGTLPQENSPLASKESVPHSTPQNAGKRKSPSPTYTPILKKLMLKNMSNQTRGVKSRLSSHRFQTEPFLAGIREEVEEELKDHQGVVEENVSIHATANTSTEKNSSEQRSRNSVGSEQIDLTMTNTYGFRMSLENLQNVKTVTQHQFITVMSVEIFVITRGNLNPDPESDHIHCIFYSIFHDENESSKLKSGIIIVDNGEYQLDVTRFNCEKQFVKTENELLDNFITLVEQWDPDILIGYEIEMLSWGYLIQRAQHLGRNYIVELSRVKEEKKEAFKEKTLIEDSEYSDDFKLIGRIVLNVWRLMRHEIALQSYSYENILFHVLHQRVPKHSFQVLTKWWRNSLRKWIVIDYYLLRVESNIKLLQQLDFFGRTSELARLFGIQFYEVLSRGSQFRVESMMLRLAKKQNFIAVSPSVKQRAKMRAPESLPLIMEPESKYYTDPVIVLDFQSLYPSIIIAYNYCFSTCIGRVEHLVEKETFNFGCIQHTVPVELVSKLQSSLNISPCGVAFVKQSVRRGILPEMLEEILSTRLMVKKSMKENKDDKTLQRVLHARQLGLKLIANVTYGYTSANFSGRMPCIEVGDSVVSKGRETLERVIEMVSKNEKWAAKVVYGDTDSIFVMVPKRSKEEAFRIGAEIVEAVTNDNPKPVKLKLEKVYYPCILQTKKRYVGYMYESCDQKVPTYDAKGIETVRRDGCPAVAKILEKSLKLLFDRNEVSRVKQYVQRQFTKLVTGRLSIQELTFAREYRGMNNYKPAACVPALQLARQAILRDRRSEPRVKERVRYVLTVGPPGVPLIKSVLTPEEFLDTPGAIINAEYYITRAIIPALERCFSLLGVDVRVWYAELPRNRKSYLPVENDLNNKAYKKKTISHYFATSKCVACKQIAVAKVCKECQKNPQTLALTIGTMINKLQRRYNYLEKICRSCTSRNDSVECSSLDCASYYNYRQAVRDVEQIPYLEELQQMFLRRSSNI